MVYDEAHQQLVLFGGAEEDRTGTVQTPMEDLWTFDGTDWTNRTPANPPTARTGCGMAYDSKRQRVWFFGGRTSQYAFPIAELNDTFWWDGTSFQTASPQVSPPGLAMFQMVYEPTRDELVTFGGSNEEDYGPTGETWLYGPP
jgi:hypothetical protein